MGRHNTIAGRMAESSAARGRLFTKLAREIMVTARNGTDTNTNAALRSAVAKARDHDMPKDNIERAIKKGSGESTAAQFEHVVYEGYGPGGCALMIEVLTDNRNRTHPELRRLFQKHGGTLGEMGVVAWMFKKMGVFVIDAQKFSEDKIMDLALNAGAEDVKTEGDTLLIVSCEVPQFGHLRDAFAHAQVSFVEAGLKFVPQDTMTLVEGEHAAACELMDRLEDHDDVQGVYSNF